MVTLLVAVLVLLGVILVAGLALWAADRWLTRRDGTRPRWEPCPDCDQMLPNRGAAHNCRMPR